MNKEYKVEFEIAGPAAMFTRPDSGAAPISYPAPTFSAVRGICDSILRFETAFIEPIKVEICAPIRYHKYTTNYGGPERKGQQIKKGNSFQLNATILVDVCYKIYGKAVERSSYKGDKTTNPLHYLQDKFLTRLKKGQFYETPCLGWKFRETSKVIKDIQIILPSMLYSIYTEKGSIEHHYKQNVFIQNGILDFSNLKKEDK